MNNVLRSLLFASFFLTPFLVQADTIQLTTYYPAPFGAYSRIILNPQDDAGIPACAAALTGTIYYSNNTGEIKVCDGTNWLAENPWKYNGTTNVYLANSDTTDLIKVGIGTRTPDLKLTIRQISATDDGGIVATGLAGTGATLTTAGGGARFIWYPRKAALRAGGVTATQWDNANIGDYSVAFGLDNRASGAQSTIAGGQSNSTTSAALHSSIGGGILNSITQTQATIPLRSVIAGGSNNTIDAAGNSVIGGGDANTIQQVTTTPSYSTISGGSSNTINAAYSVIAGGQANSLARDYAHMVIGGGESNSIATTHGTIGGGQNNHIGSWAAPPADFGTISGGRNNQIMIASSAILGTIGGGNANTVRNDYGTIAGGQSNTASGDSSSVGGGSTNTASGSSAFVGGGFSNVAAGSWSTVGGGQSNTASGPHSFIPGGIGNTIAAAATQSFAFGANNTVNGRDSVSIGTSNTVTGNNSFALGSNLTIPAGINNTFLWGSAGIAALSNAFIINSTRVGIGVLSPTVALDVNGTIKSSSLTTGGITSGDISGGGNISAAGDIFAVGTLQSTGSAGIGGAIDAGASLRVYGNIKANLNDIGGLPMQFNNGTKEIGYDVAELFETSEDVEPGDLLSIDPQEKLKLQKSRKPYEKGVIGIVSGAPAILFEGSTLQIAPTPGSFVKGTKPPVALTGRILCKVTLENGPIEAGDLLTSSSTPGHAMKASDRDKSFGAVVGKSLENFSGGPKGEKTGLIMMIATLQ